MDMHDVKSTNIRAIGYDEATREMRVFFKNGGRYILRDVPPELYQEFLQADSPGKFYVHHFAYNRSYPYRRLGEDEE